MAKATKSRGPAKVKYSNPKARKKLEIKRAKQRQQERLQPPPRRKRGY
jgi:hypothetical protein